MPATLTYITYDCNPATTCLICLEPVDEDAVKASCHGFLLCADCLGHWLTSLILADEQVKCICRSTVDASNMKPLVCERRKGRDEMVFEYGDYDDEFDADDEESMEGESYLDDEVDEVDQCDADDEESIEEDEDMEENDE